MDIKLFRQHLQQIQENKVTQLGDYYIVKNHDGGRLVYKGNPNKNGQIQAFVAKTVL